MHELYTILPVVEQKRIEDSDLWNWLYFNNGFGHDTEVTFATHDEEIHVRSVGVAWASRQFLVDTFACD